MQQTPYWTVAFSESHTNDVHVAVIGACNRDDAERRAVDVLGDDVRIVWVEPRHVSMAVAA